MRAGELDVLPGMWLRPPVCGYGATHRRHAGVPGTAGRRPHDRAATGDTAGAFHGTALDPETARVCPGAPDRPYRSVPALRSPHLLAIPAGCCRRLSDYGTILRTGSMVQRRDRYLLAVAMFPVGRQYGPPLGGSSVPQAEIGYNAGTGERGEYRSPSTPANNSTAGLRSTHGLFQDHHD